MKIYWVSIVDFLYRFLRDSAEVLKNPQSDPSTAFIIISMLSVIVLIFFLIFVVLFLLTQRRRTKTYRQPKPKTPPKAKQANRIILIVILGLLFAFLVSANIYIDRPSICGGCHTKIVEKAGRSKSSHKHMLCKKCHREPGPAGFLIQRLKYLRWFALSQTQRYEKPIEAYVSNNPCLSCHQGITRKTVNRYNIRVRHKDFLKIGSRCVECHNAVGHRIEGRVQNPSMDKCIICHDGKKASASCELCHVEDIGKDVKEASRPSTKVVLTRPETCEGCHPTKNCFNCHKIEMPHSTKFLKGTHARPGFVNRSLCFRCHVKRYDFCNKCHGFPLESDVALHGGVEQGWDKHPQHIGAKPDSCICHLRPPDQKEKGSFCDLCHQGRGYRP